MDIALKMNQVQVSFGNKKILKDINLEIQKNKITAIIGPSGCGKSTLLKTLNRMGEEEKNFSLEGEIFLEEENIKNIEKEELRKKIGMVFQNPTPFPFSIYKNMTYAPLYYGIKEKKVLNQMIKEKLKIAGLYEEVYEDLNMSALKLSGGQQQRLCIARALTVEPTILLLDEPCSALDVKNTMNIENMLMNLSKEYTLVIVTHNLQQAKRISHYTAFILEGELIEYNTTKELFENPKDEKTKEYMEGIYG